MENVQFAQNSQDLPKIDYPVNKILVMTDRS
jgi:hypothetical protein